MSNWEESKHPRDEDGKFSSKSGGGTPAEEKRLKELGIDDNSRSIKEQLKQEEIKTHNKKYIWLPEQEYAGINSVIKKRFGNDIPKQGGIFYKNDYYVYNFNEFTDQILCIEKLDIDKDEARIALLEDLWKKKQ